MEPRHSHSLNPESLCITGSRPGAEEALPGVSPSPEPLGTTLRYQGGAYEDQNQGATVRCVGAPLGIPQPNRGNPGQRAASTVQPTHRGRPGSTTVSCSHQAEMETPVSTSRKELRWAGSTTAGQGVGSQVVSSRGSRPGNPGSNLKPREPHFPHLNSACHPAFSLGGEVSPE